MKTLEQVKEHLSTTYYDCSDKICGFLVGCELKDPKEVIKFLKDDDYVYDFDDFLGWFDEKYDEEDCDGCDCNCSKSGISDETSSSTEEQLLELSKLYDDLFVALRNSREYATANIIFRNILDGSGNIREKEEPKDKPFKYQGEEREKLNKDRIEMKTALNHYAYICKRDPQPVNTVIYDALLKNVLIIFDKLQERVDE